MARVDEFDSEAQYLKDHQLKVGFHLSFKVMSQLIDKLIDETGEVTDKYPKSELLTLWATDMGIFFVLFLFSHGLILLATLLFYFFYGFVLIKIFKAWANFKYKLWQILLLTVGTLGAEFVVTYFIKSLIFK